MTDQEKRERLKAGLNGHWEYICKVTSAVPFENDERGRGGRMIITVSLDWTGVGAYIEAERLWATTDQNNDQAKRVAVRDPIPWRAEGGVVIRDGRLSFEYFASDVEGRGVTKDTFHLFEEEKLYFDMGSFTHSRKDGQLVTGIVKLRKMDTADDFQWAPPDIKPGGTSVSLLGKSNSRVKPNSAGGNKPSHISVAIGNAGNFIIGDVGGTVVSDHMTQIEIKTGDMQALVAALKEIKISDDDIKEITTIVKEEKPSQKTLGNRAADWVGRMLSKSLTGSWEVGKRVAPAILSEILLRYYGLK